MFLRVSGGNVDIAGGDGTGTSGGSDTVGENLLTGVLEVGVGEDETDVTWKKTGQLGASCMRKSARRIHSPLT